MSSPRPAQRDFEGITSWPPLRLPSHSRHPRQQHANYLNSVFEYVHKNEIKQAKDEGIMTAAQFETIVHPNEYFKRSYLLKNLGKSRGSSDVKMEGV